MMLSSAGHCIILWIAFLYGSVAGSLDRCPNDFKRVGEYKTEHGDMCYIFINTEKTWVDAREHCWSWGGELIMIKNQEKMNFVIHTMNSVLRWRNNGVWIGAHDRNGKGWEWTTGEKLTWGYWAPGQPSTIGGISIEDCALMRRGDGWRWHDYHCDSSLFFTYKFICQYRKVPPTTTTSTTTTTTVTPLPSTTTSTSTTTVSSTTTTSVLMTDEKIEPELIKFQKADFIADKLNQGEGSVSNSVVGGESGADNSNKDTGILAGIIVGGAILILIVAVGTLLIRRRRRNKFEDLSVQFQNLSYSRVSQSGQDGNAASNVYMDTNEMNRLYEEVNKQVNHGVNCFSGTVLDIPVPGATDSEDNQDDVCCGGVAEESDLKKLNNVAYVAMPADSKSPAEVMENHYVDMNTGNKAKETNRMMEASRVKDPSKPSNLGVDRQPMPLPLYANSAENLHEGTMEPGSTLSGDSTYINSQERFEVDEEGYMSPRATLQVNSESETELSTIDKDPLYDEIR